MAWDTLTACRLPFILLPVKKRRHPGRRQKTMRTKKFTFQIIISSEIHPTVHIEYCPCDKGGVVRAQKGDCRCNLMHRAIPSQWYFRNKLRCFLRAEPAKNTGIRRARGNRIDIDAMLCKPRRKPPRQANNPRFGRRITKSVYNPAIPPASDERLSIVPQCFFFI